MNKIMNEDCVDEKTQIKSITWLDTPFALFAGWKYYPSGGLRDYKKTYATLNEAGEAGEAFLKEEGGCYPWYQIVDLRDLTIVGENSE